jgi:hypothetical protein
VKIHDHTVDDDEEELPLMKIARHARLRVRKIESTLDRIGVECGFFESHVMQQWNKDPSKARPRTVLATDRLRDVRSLLQQFQHDEDRIATRDRWFITWRYAVLLALVALVLILTCYTLTDSDSKGAISAATLGLSIIGCAHGLMTSESAIHKHEARSRRGICQRNLHGVRAMMHVIDAHVTAKTLRGHWDTRNSKKEIAGASVPRFAADWIYQDSSTAIRYLAIASALARVCAKIAALYPQTMLDSELSREADELSLFALEIERACLEKAALIRQGALRLGQPSLHISHTQVDVEVPTGPAVIMAKAA